MAKINKRPTPGKIWDRHSRDIHDMRRRIDYDKGDIESAAFQATIPWGVEGVLSAGRSHRFRLGVAQEAYEFIAFLEEEVGSTDTIIQVRLNTVSHTTVTIPAGLDEITVALGALYNPGDDWTAAIMTPGTGAAGLQTYTRFRPA